MKLGKPIRFAIICLLGLLLAVGLAFQSASIALVHKAPERAIAFFPLNGLAEENFASAVFKSSLSVLGEHQRAAQNAEQWARLSYLHEPLTPKSLAILAMSERKLEAQTKIVGLSSRLNRREPLLQALVLQEYVSTNNYRGVVKTLDRILRVRPSKSTELFPILLNVFSQEGSVGEFEKILDGTSPWHQQFIRFALGQPSALPNLFQLRKRVSFQDQKLDQALLWGLAKEGDLNAAASLYDLWATPAGAHSNDSLGWGSTFVPFDWRLIDNADFRAQRSLDSDKLELYVRPGSGGVFASRILETPKAPFSISAKQQISHPNLVKDVKITLSCAPRNAAFSEDTFKQSGLYVPVKAVPDDCPFMEISLSARAWSGQSALRGTISPLVIKGL